MPMLVTVAMTAVGAGQCESRGEEEDRNGDLGILHFEGGYVNSRWDIASVVG